MLKLRETNFVAILNLSNIPNYTSAFCSGVPVLFCAKINRFIIYLPTLCWYRLCLVCNECKQPRDTPWWSLALNQPRQRGMTEAWPCHLRSGPLQGGTAIHKAAACHWRFLLQSFETVRSLWTFLLPSQYCPHALRVLAGISLSPCNKMRGDSNLWNRK